MSAGPVEKKAGFKLLEPEEAEQGLIGSRELSEVDSRCIIDYVGFSLIDSTNNAVKHGADSKRQLTLDRELWPWRRGRITNLKSNTLRELQLNRLVSNLTLCQDDRKIC